MSPRFILFVRRLLHYAYYVLGAAVIVVGLVALTLRFWLMPNVERFKPDIEQAASQAVGYPVRVGQLHADWQGINPRVVLTRVQVHSAGDQVLTLPQVEVVGSWLSLITLDLRLGQLLIDAPQIDLRRDKSGLITLSGLPLRQGNRPSPFPDWLLRQPSVLIKDARISWQDDLLDAPQLRLDQVRLILESRFGRHRFGVVAMPSASAARRLEVRGDLHGHSSRDLQSWYGTLYTRVDGARYENWGRWVPWAQEAVKGGVGDARFWLDVRQGQVFSVLGDANLRDVSVSLQQDLPNLVFTQLRGRLGWNHKGDEQSFFASNLRFQTPAAPLSEPAAVRVDLRLNPNGKIMRVGATARNLRLEAFTALSGTLPLPRRTHDLIAALRPRGLVEQAEGHWTQANDFAFQAALQNSGVQAYDTLPGFSGFSAHMHGDQTGGEINIDGRDAQIDMPKVFRTALPFTALDGHAVWKLSSDGLQLDYTVPRIANADLEGISQGHVWLPQKGPAVVDIRAHLSHGNARAVYRYMPKVVAEDATLWLERSLQGGYSDDARLLLKGPLDRFPFDQGGGQFNVSVRMRNAVLDYAPGWPRIDGINGLLVFHDKAMTVSADSGHILDAQIGPVRAVIPDLMHGRDEQVLIDGKAHGVTNAFLDFIRHSPVDEHSGHFAANLRAEGNADLNLRLVLPTRHIEDSTVHGLLDLHDNRLFPGEGLPELLGLSGQVDFTADQIKGKELHATVLGMPAKLDLSNYPGGQVKVQLTGRAGISQLKPYVPAKWLARLSGSSDWQATLLMNAGQAAASSIHSELVGVAINLPPPLEKKAEQALPLSLKIKPNKAAGVLLANLGDLASLRMPLGKAPRAINLRIGGGEAGTHAESGLWVTGSLPRLDIDAWRALDLGEQEDGTPLEVREVSLALNEVRLFNHRLHDTHLQLRPLSPGWLLDINGKEIIGEIMARPVQGNQYVVGNFKQLFIPEQEPGSETSTSYGENTGLLAGLEINADRFALKGRQLGELHLRLQPEKYFYRLDQLVLTTPDGKLELHGRIARHPRRETHLQIDTESTNLAQVLARIGQEGVMRGGDMQVHGSLGWTGGLQEFNLDRLNSDVNVKLKNGQFLKVDPGAAKLIGILSLQSLPRRISLDFRDVFSQGFAFDEINGNVHLEDGAAYFREIRMRGPAAKIQLSGVANLRNETQQLRVKVEPSIEDTAALAAGLLGGPVVGIGAYLANKVLKNPIGQAVSFSYQVSGSWNNPKVVKLSSAQEAEQALPGQ